MEKLFSEVKELLVDQVKVLVMHDGLDEEYEIDLGQLSGEVHLLRSIFEDDELDQLVIDGIDVESGGFGLLFVNTESNALIFNSVAKKYHLAVTHRIFN